MRQIVFIDKNNNIVDISIKFGDYVSFSGDIAGGSWQICDEIKPASPNQKRILDLWKKYHLKSYTEEVEDEIIQAADALKMEVQAEEIEFMETLGERKFWEYLRDEVEFTKDDHKLSKRVQAIFDTMGWPYHFVNSVDFAERAYSSIEVGGRWFYCGRECDMRDIAIDYLDNDEGRDLWRCAVGDKQTEKGFSDWLEEVCDWGEWTNVLDHYDGSGVNVEVDGTDYWVGRA